MVNHAAVAAGTAKLFFRQPVCWLLLALLAACLLCSFFILQYEWHLSWLRLFSSADTLPLEALMVQNNTLPRMVMAVLCGGALAVGTMLLQQVMHNPLASDSTLAVSSGAQLALLLTSIFVPSWLGFGSVWIASAGALAALALILWLSGQRESVPLTVILAGLVVNLYLGALANVLMLFYAEEAKGVILWGSGSLVQDSWSDVGQLWWQSALALAGMVLLLRPLTLIGLGDEQAASLGISVRKIRVAALVLAAALSAVVVSHVGMMGFLGLAAATIVRESGVRTLLGRLLSAWLTGALLLWLTDSLLVLWALHTDVDLPTGAVTALVGAPLLLWLMMRAPVRPQMAMVRRADAVRAVKPVWIWLLPLLLAAVLCALFWGHNGNGWQWRADLLDLRYPRMLSAAAAGIMLAAAGVILQRLTQNPMASPELLGITSGTTLGVLAVVFVLNSQSVAALWLAGLAGALLTLWLIVLLNRKNGMQPEKTLLTGVAVAALSAAVVQVWLASGDLRIQYLLVWLAGSTYQSTALLSGSLFVVALILLVLCLPLQRWLALLGLSGMVAQSAGVPVRRARMVLIILSAALTALATLLVGPLSFVGLLAPHLARMLGSRTPVQQLLCAAALGALVMIAADWLGRQVMFPYEIPAGLVATLLGGAYFLWMMRKI